MLDLQTTKDIDISEYSLKYNLEEFALLFGCAARGLLNDKFSGETVSASLPSDLFFIYPSKPPEAMNTAIKLLKNKFSSKSNPFLFDIQYMQVDLKEDHYHMDFGKTEETEYYAYFSSDALVTRLLSDKNEKHKYLLFGISVGQPYHTGKQLDAITDLVRRVIDGLAKEAENGNENAKGELDISIVIGDTLQAYNDFTDNNEQNNSELAAKQTVWERQGEKWFNENQSKFKMLKAFSNSGVIVNVTFYKWQELLEKAQNYGFTEMYEYLETTYKNNMKLGEVGTGFRQHVNNKGNQYQLKPISRQGLDFSLSQQLQNSLRLSNKIIGKSVPGVGSFFDAISAAMNSLDDVDTYSAKAIRMACFDLSKTVTFRERMPTAYENVQYTEAEIKFYPELTSSFQVYDGYPYLEAKMLCYATKKNHSIFLDGIRIIEFNNDSVDGLQMKHFLVTKEGSTDDVNEANIENEGKRIVTLLVKKGTHNYFPVLNKNKNIIEKNQKTKRPSTRLIGFSHPQRAHDEAHVAAQKHWVKCYLNGYNKAYGLPDFNLDRLNSGKSVMFGLPHNFKEKAIIKRQAYIQFAKDQFKSPSKATVQDDTRIVNYWGFRGNGKTSLALDYFKDANGYGLQLWIRSEKIAQDYEKLAQNLEFKQEQRKDKETARKNIIDYLIQRENRTLIVFDDVKNYDAVKHYIPSLACDVIITSQQEIMTRDNLVNQAVGSMEKSESVAYLKLLTGIEDEYSLLRLAEELKHYPLGIELAALYLKHEGKSADEFRATLKEKPDELIDYDPTEVDPSEWILRRIISRTVDMSINAVANKVIKSRYSKKSKQGKKNEPHYEFPFVRDILLAISYLAADNIPVELIQRWFEHFYREHASNNGCEENDNSVSKGITSFVQEANHLLNLMFREMNTYGLLTDVSHNVVSVIQMVQIVIREGYHHQEKSGSTKTGFKRDEYLEFVAKDLNNKEYTNFEVICRYYAHLTSITHFWKRYFKQSRPKILEKLLRNCCCGAEQQGNNIQKVQYQREFHENFDNLRISGERLIVVEINLARDYTAAGDINNALNMIKQLLERNLNQKIDDPIAFLKNSLKNVEVAGMIDEHLMMHRRMQLYHIIGICCYHQMHYHDSVMFLSFGIGIATYGVAAKNTPGTSLSETLYLMKLQHAEALLLNTYSDPAITNHSMLMKSRRELAYKLGNGAYAQWINEFKDNATSLAMANYRYGSLLMKLFNFQDSVKYQEKAVELYSSVYGMGHINRAHALFELSRAKGALLQIDEALSGFNETLQIYESNNLPDYSFPVQMCLRCIKDFVTNNERDVFEKRLEKSRGNQNEVSDLAEQYYRLTTKYVSRTIQGTQPTTQTGASARTDSGNNRAWFFTNNQSINCQKSMGSNIPRKALMLLDKYRIEGNSIAAITKAMQLAAKNNYIEDLKTLLGCNIDINKQDKKKKTALHYAIWNNSISAVTLLCDAGARIDIPDDEDMTAWDVAFLCEEFNKNGEINYSEEREKIIDILKNHAKDVHQSTL